MAQNHQSKFAVHRSPALSALCNRFEDDESWDILELGPAVGGNIEFWSRFGTSIHVSDLRSMLPLPVSVQENEEEEPAEPDWNHLLGLPEGRRFDLLLAWDLLNYLELKAVASLANYLSRFCQQGSILFALISDQQSMPEEPGIYRIVDEEHLSYNHGSTKMVACPRHQPRSLAGMIPAFSTSNSFRLRNGIIEYLFSYEGDADSPGTGK